MQFFYGNYYHSPNSVAFSGVNRTFVRGQSGRVHLLHVDWQLDGKLLGVNQADIFNQLNVMMLAYTQDGLSAGLLDNNGNLTPFTMNGALALGGVRVTSPVSHQQVKGADGVTYLKYKIGLAADFPYASALDVMSFSEQLSFTNNNGGPIFVERIPAQGSPILQQVTEQSWFFASQSGSLTQSGPFPQPMSPIFPPAYIRTGGNAGQQVSYSSPKTIRAAPIEYGVQWKYEFISPTPLIGWPNVVG